MPFFTKKILFFFCLFFSAACVAFASENNTPQTEQNLSQEVKAILYICSSGLNIEVSGELEAGIAKFLMKQLEAKGEVNISAGGFQTLLEQFSDEKIKMEVYKMFNECVKNCFETIYNFRKKENIPKNFKSGKILIPEPLVTVSPGQAFALSVGQSISLIDSRTFFSVERTRYDGATPCVILSEPSRKLHNQPAIGENTHLKSKPCWVTFYAANKESKTYSFVLQCSE